MTSKQITIFISVIYFILGNIVGYLVSTLTISSDGLLFYLFIPYTFNWILSSIAGFDWLTIVFEIIALLISFAFFFPIGLYFAKPRSKA
jgi:hypothetical protein